MSKYEAMTVNERLFAAGLLEAFDRAAARHDSAELARILKEAALSEADIQGVIEWVAHSPYSEFNREPIVLRPELVADRRVVALVTVPPDSSHRRCGRTNISRDTRGKYGGRLSVQRSMRSDVVVMRPPTFDA